MKSIITFVVSLFITQSAYAVCGFSPAPCEFPTAPVETSEQFCFDGTCNNVTGEWFGDFYVVRSVLPTGYGVIGWGGPCPQHDCPDIGRQARRMLDSNADFINRAWYR